MTSCQDAKPDQALKMRMVSWRAGRSIEWDGDREQILNDSRANELLQRPYRSPWKYPEV